MNMEISVNELRIRNLVTIDNPHWPELKGVPVYISEIRCYEREAISVKYNDETYNQLIKFIKPIPLTEKWFDRLPNEEWEFVGFGTRRILKHKTFKSIEIELSANDCFSFYFNGELIQFIHQLHILQNVFHALTKTELIIKNQ